MNDLGLIATASFKNLNSGNNEIIGQIIEHKEVVKQNCPIGSLMSDFPMGQFHVYTSCFSHDHLTSIR